MTNKSEDPDGLEGGSPVPESSGGRIFDLAQRELVHLRGILESKARTASRGHEFLMLCFVASCRANELLFLSARLSFARFQLLELKPV